MPRLQEEQEAEWTTGPVSLLHHRYSCFNFASFTIRVLGATGTLGAGDVELAHLVWMEN